MKTFNVSFRKSYEVLHQIEVDASSEQAAINKARKIAMQTSAGDDQSTESCIEAADDFCVWQDGDL